MASISSLIENTKNFSACKNYAGVFSEIMKKYELKDFSKSSKPFRRKNVELASVYADLEATRKRFKRAWKGDNEYKRILKEDMRKIKADYQILMDMRNHMALFV